MTGFDSAAHVKVMATRDFLVGPFRYVAIARGETRAVIVDRDGTFWTVTQDGSLFGTCALGDGWEQVDAS